MLRHVNEQPEGKADRGRLTAVRREVKYVLDQQDAEHALKEMTKHVPLKVYDGSSSSFRVSVYLDCPDRALAHAELKAVNHASIKLRAKDYYLVEQGKPVFEKTCFLEVKARLGRLSKRADSASTARTWPAFWQTGRHLSPVTLIARRSMPSRTCAPAVRSSRFSWSITIGRRSRIGSS